MHISTLEIRFKEAYAIYFLDIDTSVCLESVIQRELQERTDFPNHLNKQKGNFEAFECGVLEFEEKRKPRIIELHKNIQARTLLCLKQEKNLMFI